MSASFDGTLKSWDLEDGRLVRTFRSHSSPVTALAVTSDARILISASLDHTLRVWDLESGRELRVLQNHNGDVTALAITPLGGQIVSGFSDGSIKVWQAQSGRQEHNIQTESGSVKTLAPDGSWGIFTSKDCSLNVRNLQDDLSLDTFTSDTEVCSCAVVPGSRTIVAGEASGRIHFLRLVLPEDPSESVW